ncbi:MAG: TRAP transporter substrate-binding protein DctP [Acidiferrobacterales bacterium]
MRTREHSNKNTHLLPALMLAVAMLVAPGVQAVTLKVATIAPDGTDWMKKMRAGAKEVKARTQGRVKFKFYPGGVMGSDKTVRRKIRIGQLQGGAITGGVLYDVFPDSQIYSLPMLFNDYKEMDYVRARLDKRVKLGLENGGFVTFGFSEGGFAYIMSKKPIKTIEDFRKRKVWVPEGDLITQAVFKNIGVSPIPLPIADVYTGLQTGLIDTIGASPIGAIVLQWHTQVKYVTDTPLMYLYGVLAIDRRAFNRIKPADQKIVREIMGQVFAKLNKQNRIDNESAKQALIMQGLKFIPMDKAEFIRLKAKVAETRLELGKKGMYTQSMYRSLIGHLAKYRGNHPDAIQ